jgi:hypothetical protein
LIVYPGTYTENPTLPAFGGINISAANTESSAQSYTFIDGTLTIDTAATNATINGINIDTLDITGTAAAFINNVSVVTAINKSSSGNVVFTNPRNNFTATVAITGSGITRFNDGIGTGIITVNNASANVTVKNIKIVNSPVNTSGTLYIVDSACFTAGTYAVTSAAGLLSMFNSQTFNLIGSVLKPIQVTGGTYSIINCPIDYATSDLAGGTNSNLTSTFGAILTTSSLTVDEETSNSGIIISKGNDPTLANIAIGNAETLENTTTGAIQNFAIGSRALRETTTGQNNVAIGQEAGRDNTTGDENLSIGTFAGSSNITGSHNTLIGVSAMSGFPSGGTAIDRVTAIGGQALNLNEADDVIGIGYRSGNSNTTGLILAIGNYALENNTTGTNNISIGHLSMQENTIGDSNTAIGVQALQDNTTGTQNTAVGTQSQSTATTAGSNTSLGYNTLNVNTGSFNTAVGAGAMEFNTTGTGNSAFGIVALRNNTTGSGNMAFGNNTLETIVTGSNNIAIGADAMKNATGGNNQIGIGANSLKANTSGSGNLALGANALEFNTTGLNNQAQGEGALRYQTTAIANTAIGNISGNITTGGFNTFVGAATMINNVTGNTNTIIGQQAGVNTSDNVATLGTIVPGSGYTDATYTNVNLISDGTTPVGPTPLPATIVVSGGAVTSVTLTGFKGGVTTSTVLIILASSAPVGLDTGSGFSVPVATINTTGVGNVMIGRRAGQNAFTSDRNVYIGLESGQNSNGGTDNVFLGYRSGKSETGSNKLYIENSDSATPLIYGEFDTNNVKINGDLQLTTKTPASASDTGITGTIAWDADYIYICTATNTWKRVAISTW